MANDTGGPGANAALPRGEVLSHVDEIRFLAEVAHLAATARTWDELMGTVIYRARAAARAAAAGTTVGAR